MRRENHRADLRWEGLARLAGPIHGLISLAPTVVDVDVAVADVARARTHTRPRAVPRRPAPLHAMDRRAVHLPRSGHLCGGAGLLGHSPRSFFSPGTRLTRSSSYQYDPRGFTDSEGDISYSSRKFCWVSKKPSNGTTKYVRLVAKLHVLVGSKHGS